MELKTDGIKKIENGQSSLEGIVKGDVVEITNVDWSGQDEKGLVVYADRSGISLRLIAVRTPKTGIKVNLYFIAPKDNPTKEVVIKGSKSYIYCEGSPDYIKYDKQLSMVGL